MTRPKPLILLILDGLGVSLEKDENPILLSDTKNLTYIEEHFPFTTLQASGIAVGLPWGEAGNSEVGHLTIGAGKVIYHHLPRIITSIYDGSFFTNDAFLKAAGHVRSHNSRLHIAGLISSGSVHSYIDHLYALLEFTKKTGLEPVYLHLFTDGKDAPPREAAKFYRMLEQRIKSEWPQAKFSSIIGRFYALDRDEKWQRTQTAYDLMTRGIGEKITDIPEYLEKKYEEDITDEFITPAAVVGGDEEPIGTIKDGDVLIFLDFREDSMREIAHAFVDETHDKFPRKKISNLLVVTMTEYEKGLNALAAYPPIGNEWPLSRVLSEAGLKHLHIAETQKYAHITYFFNGGREEPYPLEDRILIPSLDTVHFDEFPQMRAPEILTKILENFVRYDVVIANFANADMVGHSGNLNAAIKAINTLDSVVGKIMETVLANEGVLLITADHGNIELKRQKISGEIITEHSINPVPLYLVGNRFMRPKPRRMQEIWEQKKIVGGILTDIAPTMIEILGLQKPREMNGKSLLKILSSQV